MNKNNNIIKRMRILRVLPLVIIAILGINIYMTVYTKGVLEKALYKNSYYIEDVTIKLGKETKEETSYLGIIKIPNIKNQNNNADYIFLDKEDVVKIITPIIVAIILILVGFYFLLKKIEICNKQKLKLVTSLDSLTELINYDKFVLEAQEYLSKRKKNNCIMVCFDVDKFKLVNDVYGYKTGDEILKCVSQNMKMYFGETVVYGRLTGDVFGLVMELSDKKEKIPDIAIVLRQKIGNISSMNVDINIDLSIGIYDIEDEENNLKKIIDSADMARLKSKESRYQSYVLFDENLSKEKKKIMQIEQDLFSAIKNKEFTLYYQPKFNINTDKIVGSEALIRWIHPIMGIISPMVFIPVAEKTRFINNIGQWVFEEVCLRLREWIEKGIEVVPIAINLSRVELYQQDLVGNLENCLKKYNIDPKLIEIEITETTALNDIEFMNDKLNDIKALGIKVAMDDFGTGSSNLSNLKDIPIDVLKLDRSLLLDIENNTKTEVMVKSILALSKNLNLSTVCEGVENMNQIEVLKSTGCEVVQGYVFSKPLEIDIYINLLKENTVATA